MKHELTNLLPVDRARSLKQLYFFRLCTVAVLVLAGVAIVHGVLLLPSYLFVRAQVAERGQALEALSTSLAGAGEQEVSTRVSTLATDSAYLATLSDIPKASSAVAALIKVPHSGIRLVGFSFEPDPQGATRMTISGIATTRESLRSFEQALTEQSYIARVDLPISAYAKESNIDFLITLTGSFTP